MGRFPLRAEDLPPSEVARIAVENPSATLIQVLADRLKCSDPLLNPTVLVGPKGSGKTFAVISAAISLSKPIQYYIYRNPHQIEEISGRLGLNGVIPRAYVFDDVHYICEAVAGGFEDVKVLEDFVSKAISLAERGFPVVIVSEDPPHIYFEDLGAERLISLKEYFTCLHLLFVEPLSYGDWAKIVGLYGISGDELGLSLTYALSPRPRFFLKLAAEAGDLTIKSIIKLAAERLEERGKPGSLSSAVLPIPLEHLKKISKIWNEVDEIECEREFFRRVAGAVASSIRRNVKSPFAPGTSLYNKWISNNMFVIKAYSRRFGFPFNLVRTAMKAIDDRCEPSSLIPLFRNYIKYDYEEIRQSIEKIRQEVWSLAGYTRLSEEYVFKPKIFIEAFSDLLETPTVEVVRKMMNKMWLEEKWRILFNYFKKKRPNFNPEELKNLRRAFLNNARSGLAGRGWMKKIMTEALFKTP